MRDTKRGTSSAFFFSVPLNLRADMTEGRLRALSPPSITAPEGSLRCHQRRLITSTSTSQRAPPEEKSGMTHLLSVSNAGSGKWAAF